MMQEINMRTLEAIKQNAYAGRQIKEAALSFLFAGNAGNAGSSYRAPNRAWRTAIWFATGQRLLTVEEAFYQDWNGQEWEAADE